MRGVLRCKQAGGARRRRSRGKTAGQTARPRHHPGAANTRPHGQKKNSQNTRQPKSLPRPSPAPGSLDLPAQDTYSARRSGSRLLTSNSGIPALILLRTPLPQTLTQFLGFFGGSTHHLRDTVVAHKGEVIAAFRYEKSIPSKHRG
jgi:hypothetical protein